MSSLYWPDFKFDPINLYSIGPAYAKDSGAAIQPIVPMANGLHPVQGSSPISNSLLITSYYSNRSNN